MKKISILAAGLVALLCATSCSSDDQPEGVANGNEANVSFTLELPKGLASRAFGDGTTATNLTYSVWDVTDATSQIEVYTNRNAGGETITFNDLQTTKSFKLVNGRTYNFVFWADCGSTSPYTFDGKQVTVDYTGVQNNEETRDAFFNVIGMKVTGSFTQTVELRRPFAQLNLGTDDLTEKVVTDIYGANCANLNTKLTVKVPNALNLIDGTVAEQSAWTEVTFGPNGIPTGETFPVEHPEKPTKSYGYLSMNYLLMPDAKSVIDVKYELYNGTATEAAKTLNITNVPVQRNYRTNIFGSLLTSEGIFNIIIKPEFEKPGNDVEVVPVADAATLNQVLADGGSVALTKDIVLEEPLTVSSTEPVSIDLGGNTLTTKVENAINGDLTISGGKINTTLDATGVSGLRQSFKLTGTSSTLTLDNVEVKSNSVGIGMFYDEINNSKLILKDTKIDAHFYGIATNATNAVNSSKGLDIEIDNCEISSDYVTAVFVNIPCNVKITNSKINGVVHGAFLRGGNVSIENTAIKQNIAAYGHGVDRFESTNWGNGSFAPGAALTIGNRGTGSAYQYPTVVNLKNCTVEAAEFDGKQYPTVYAWANQGEGLGVTFDFDNKTTFTGGQPVYGSSNITVNGDAK